jgi:hypothetical protein
MLVGSRFRFFKLWVPITAPAALFVKQGTINVCCRGFEHATEAPGQLLLGNATPHYVSQRQQKRLPLVRIALVLCLPLPATVPCFAVHRKSFIETRSIGAVAVAFSRVYMLHSILLCWMSLLVGATPMQ